MNQILNLMLSHPVIWMSVSFACSAVGFIGLAQAHSNRPKTMDDDYNTLTLAEVKALEARDQYTSMLRRMRDYREGK